MNLKQFSIALLISALPLSVMGQARVQFQHQDFKAAERVNEEGQTVLKVKLSKSGKAKLKRLKQNDVMETELAGARKDFVIKAPIQGESVEIGPFTQKEAVKVLGSFEP
jgi:hypothetical protein